MFEKHVSCILNLIYIYIFEIVLIRLCGLSKKWSFFIIIFFVEQAMTIDTTKTKATSITKDKRTNYDWKFFTLIPNLSSNYPRIAYNFFQKQYASHPKRNGTSNLWTHLELQCSKYPHKAGLKKKNYLILRKY